MYSKKITYLFCTTHCPHSLEGSKMYLKEQKISVVKIGVVYYYKFKHLTKIPKVELERNTAVLQDYK